MGSLYQSDFIICHSSGLVSYRHACLLAVVVNSFNNISVVPRFVPETVLSVNQAVLKLTF